MHEVIDILMHIARLLGGIAVMTAGLALALSGWPQEAEAAAPPAVEVRPQRVPTYQPMPRSARPGAGEALVWAEEAA